MAIHVDHDRRDFLINGTLLLSMGLATAGLYNILSSRADGTIPAPSDEQPLTTDIQLFDSAIAAEQTDMQIDIESMIHAYANSESELTPEMQALCENTCYLVKTFDAVYRGGIVNVGDQPYLVSAHNVFRNQENTGLFDKSHGEKPLFDVILPGNKQRAEIVTDNFTLPRGQEETLYGGIGYIPLEGTAMATLTPGLAVPEESPAMNTGFVMIPELGRIVKLQHMAEDEEHYFFYTHQSEVLGIAGAFAFDGSQNTLGGVITGAVSNGDGYDVTVRKIRERDFASQLTVPIELS